MEITLAPRIPGDVHDILNFGMNLAHRECRSTDTFPKHSPTIFHDKHLDENYILKRVISLPMLLTDLLNFANELLESVKEFPKPSFPASATQCYPVNDLNADAIANHYQDSISEACCYLASHFALHSKAHRWRNVLSWTQLDDSRRCLFPLPRARAKRRLEEDHFVARKWSLVLLRNTPSVAIDVLTSDEQKTWKYLSDCSEKTELAVWDIFSCTMSSDYIFESIRNIAQKSTKEKTKIPWNRPNTKGFRIEHVPFNRCPDAIRTPWISESRRNIPVSVCQNKAYRCSEASDCNIGTSQLLPQKPVDIRPLDSMNKEHIDVGDEPSNISAWGEDYLQRAWARAVDIDATFIVFHRGTTEIICIRHRASQTLFISDIIETSANYYGKLQTALYAAILKDRAERQEIWERDHPPTAKVTAGKKRSFNHVESDNSGRMRKRRRSNSVGADPIKNTLRSPLTLKERCEKLELAIVSLNYSWQRSIIPSLFIRRKFEGREFLAPLSVQPVYPLASCLRIDVKSWIGRGTSGDAHRGTLYICSDEKQFEEVVVKVGRDDYSRQSMRHELQIYEHLARAKVQSVPHCYGFFEDIESKDSPYILITSYAGESLASIQRREYLVSNDPVVIPKSQHPAFLRSLAEVHAAGIHHRDLRSPNIVIDKNGKVSIIDFDLARPYITGQQRKHERKRMLKLLSGESVDYDRTTFRDGNCCDDCSPGTDHKTSEGGNGEEEPVRAYSEPPYTS
ncbi:hypothetical protein J3R30DRAFT_2280291 [Lentinula aciculospora]|uniref:Protein kinase domain-containing protein n=1 Tax=Lentinula aciculospora TaxID=153920 RepID=A0A9W9DF92_9AGAR|nr:hypothetical protein J3R30DRAFT_2280291 [Lentinula aciculospora]